MVSGDYGSVGAELWEVVVKAGEILTKEDCYAPLGIDRPEPQEVVKESWWKCLWNNINAAFFNRRIKPKEYTHGYTNLL